MTSLERGANEAIVFAHGEIERLLVFAHGEIERLRAALEWAVQELRRCDNAEYANHIADTLGEALAGKGGRE